MAQGCAARVRLAVGAAGLRATGAARGTGSRWLRRRVDAGKRGQWGQRVALGPGHHLCPPRRPQPCSLSRQARELPCITV